MYILENIDVYWFLISLFVGLFVVYSTAITPEVIIKYPTPENAHDMIFRDDVDNCYKFNTTEIQCPVSDKIFDIPINHSKSNN